MTAKYLTLKFKEADLGMVSFIAGFTLNNEREDEFLKELYDDMTKDAAQDLINQFGEGISQAMRHGIRKMYGQELCTDLLSYFNSKTKPNEN